MDLRNIEKKSSQNKLMGVKFAFGIKHCHLFVHIILGIIFWDIIFKSFLFEYL